MTVIFEKGYKNHWGICSEIGWNCSPARIPILRHASLIQPLLYGRISNRALL